MRNTIFQVRLAEFCDNTHWKGMVEFAFYWEKNYEMRYSDDTNDSEGLGIIDHSNMTSACKLRQISNSVD